MTNPIRKRTDEAAGGPRPRDRSVRWGAFLLALAFGLLPSGYCLAGAPSGGPSLLILAQPRQGEGANWLLFGGIGLIALMVILPRAILVIRGQGGTDKKAGRVKATENQIDDYRLVNLMMTGQTSQVWEAAEVSSGRHFALKMLLPENVHKGDQRAFLFHEYEVGSKIVHPKIIKMLKVVRDRDHPYLLMEFFPSTNLKLRLMHKDPFLKEHLREILEQASTALAFMHQRGWVHRDVKPDNILVNASVEVRLIDFALAQRLSRKKPGRLRRKGIKRVMGTRSYMSPEQIRGEPLDERSDLYSFGATIYELVTGRPPFRANTPSELLAKQLNDKPEPPNVYNPELTREMNDLIMLLLNKDRDKRPRDFHEFLAKFRGIRPFKIVPVKRKE